MSGGIITTAVKHLMAAGVVGERLLEAIAEMEAVYSPPPPQKSKGAIRTQRWRENKASQNVTERHSETECDAKEIPPNPHKKTTPPSKPKGLGSRGSRLPDDFTIPDEWITWAMQRRRWSRADTGAEGEKFCRYWQAKTGAGATKRDWFKTWQNWVDASHRPDGSAAVDSGRFSSPEARQAYLASLEDRQRGPPRAIGEIVGKFQAGVG